MRWWLFLLLVASCAPAQPAKDAESIRRRSRIRSALESGCTDARACQSLVRDALTELRACRSRGDDCSDVEAQVEQAKSMTRIALVAEHEVEREQSKRTRVTTAEEPPIAPPARSNVDVFHETSRPKDDCESSREFRERRQASFASRLAEYEQKAPWIREHCTKQSKVLTSDELELQVHHDHIHVVDGRTASYESWKCPAGAPFGIPEVVPGGFMIKPMQLRTDRLEDERCMLHDQAMRNRGVAPPPSNDPDDIYK